MREDEKRGEKRVRPSHFVVAHAINTTRSPLKALFRYVFTSHGWLAFDGFLRPKSYM
jgi:hypothetical protein